MMLISVQIFILCISAINIIHASCPNRCNGRGVCDKFSRCSCSDGFQGADCSERICPFNIAWTDNAVGIDKAHNLAECSNRGICERSSGKCTCMPGFTGSACERLDCYRDCSGRGICYTMEDFALRTRFVLAVPRSIIKFPITFTTILLFYLIFAQLRHVGVVLVRLCVGPRQDQGLSM